MVMGMVEYLLADVQITQVMLFPKDMSCKKLTCCRKWTAS
uniref:Uncharacterized protein n=1 Tax=Brassica campestris TaxID=3711 RepID=A0A3P5Z1U5_BRACM|nr:unnamed protein product [Brassica rapa]